MYELHREVWIPRPVEEVFDFFRRAENLEVLTPPWLGFRVLTPQPIAMFPGALIDYRLQVRGLPVRWRTRIESWNPPHSFTDTQLRGPYRLWHHTHAFEARDGGTLMTDHVRYALPFGPFGRLAHWLLVRRDVERIFDYRTERIRGLFPAPAQHRTVSFR